MLLVQDKEYKEVASAFAKDILKMLSDVVDKGSRFGPEHARKTATLAAKLLKVSNSTVNEYRGDNRFAHAAASSFASLALDLLKSTITMIGIVFDGN